MTAVPSGAAMEQAGVLVLVLVLVHGLRQTDGLDLHAWRRAGASEHDGVERIDATGASLRIDG